MNTVYLVVQQAVYRHKIMGAYTGLWEAQQAIEKYINSPAASDSTYGADADGHHCYEICTLVVDQPIEKDTDADCVRELMRPYKKGDETTTYTWVEV